MKNDKIARNPRDPHNFDSKYHIKGGNASQFLPESDLPTGGKPGNPRHKKKQIEKPPGF